MVNINSGNIVIYIDLKLTLNIFWWFLLFAKIQIIILSREIIKQIYTCLVHKVARDDLNLEFFFIFLKNSLNYSMMKRFCSFLPLHRK